jgi:Protein of unknown function (DUF4231)
VNKPEIADFSYIRERFRPQLDYFEKKAALNQGRFLLMRRMMLIASWLTPIAIFIQFTVPPRSRDLWSIVPMILSTVAVGSYQWEEQHNYGSQWSKFRLVAENLKHQLVYFENHTGPFRELAQVDAERTFVEVIEKIIEGTDINYFTLMIDPHKAPGAER